MKEFLRTWIKAIRFFLDRAEASLKEVPHQKSEGIPTQKAVQDGAPLKVRLADGDDILVPFRKGNSSGTQSTHKDRKSMNALLDEWVSVSGMDSKQAKAMLRKHEDVIRIDYMTIGQVNEACAWLRGQIEKKKQQS